MKDLTFDVNEINIIPRTNLYITLNIKTEFCNEILAEFTPAEIIENYYDLASLYQVLKEYFNEDN